MVRQIGIDHQQQGFAYIWMLLVLMMLAMGLGQWAVNYSTLQQRYKEQELLRIGSLYQEAIYRFYINSPGSLKSFPIKLEDLLRDPRQVKVIRYMRRLEKDPVTDKDFITVRNNNNQIIGVISTSKKTPIKTKNFSPSMEGFEYAKSYSDWKFFCNASTIYYKCI